MSDITSLLLTATEVAEAFKVSPSTVTRWAREGIVPCIRTPGGHPRFLREDVERLLGETGSAA